MLDVFRRMSESILTHLGEDALLRGDTPCRVNVERSTGFLGETLDTYVVKTVITIAHVDTATGVALLPEQGDLLVVNPDGKNGAPEHYVLDAPVGDNGVNCSFVAVITS